jgi:hypothetical protein
VPAQDLVEAEQVEDGRGAGSELRAEERECRAEPASSPRTRQARVGTELRTPGESALEERDVVLGGALLRAEEAGGVAQPDVDVAQRDRRDRELADDLEQSCAAVDGGGAAECDDERGRRARERGRYELA